jgi:pimeloyl-ACP methyl ester carboxylesterase
VSLLSSLCGTAALALSVALPLLPTIVLAQGGPKTQITNVVLVHGAWVDGSSWSRVIPLLESKGLHVTTVQIPLTSLNDDVATTQRALALIDGPVILVGHSYGGVVITQAGNDPKVKGLVFISAFAPDAGESALSILKASTVASPAGSEILPDKAGFTRISRKGIDEDFAEEMSPVEKAVLFSTQGPTSAPNALAAVVTEAAWKSKPSWTLITAQDRVIPVAIQQSMAKKIGSQSTTISASHLALLAHPQDIASVIEQAARGTEQSKQ